MYINVQYTVEHCYNIYTTTYTTATNCYYVEQFPIFSHIRAVQMEREKQKHDFINSHK